MCRSGLGGVEFQQWLLRCGVLRLWTLRLFHLPAKLDPLLSARSLRRSVWSHQRVTALVDSISAHRSLLPPAAQLRLSKCPPLFLSPSEEEERGPKRSGLSGAGEEEEGRREHWAPVEMCGGIQAKWGGALTRKAGALQ